MRKHARHYRGNSNWNSMELVGFLRWGYSRPLPPPLSLHRCFTRRKSIGPLFFALFISRAQCFDYEWGHEEEKKREGWNGAAKEQSGTHIPGLREETNQVINWREKRRKGGGGANRVEEKPMSPGQID